MDLSRRADMRMAKYEMRLGDDRLKSLHALARRVAFEANVTFTTGDAIRLAIDRLLRVASRKASVKRFAGRAN
jgi:hypothetical protein